jgi:hypothetical protein
MDTAARYGDYRPGVHHPYVVLGDDVKWSFVSTTDAFRFRAVLTGDGSEEVEIARA